MAAERRRQRRGEGPSTTVSEHGGSQRAAGPAAPLVMSAPHAHGRAPVRRRGHQHHPRLRGERQPAPSARSDPDPSKKVTLQTQTNDVVPYVNSVSESQKVTRTNSDDALSNRNISEDFGNFDDEIEFDNRLTGAESRYNSEDDVSNKEVRSAGDGQETMAVLPSDVSDDDPETAELAKLRCTSECTEVLAERENRRRRRCADYPGLAFGSSIFSSDTMMKFSIIKNELQNIKNTALKRVMSYFICASVRVREATVGQMRTELFLIAFAVGNVGCARHISRVAIS